MAVLPEKFNTPKQSSAQLAELNAIPPVSLSADIDPAHEVIDRALSFAGARAFKIRDAANIPELLDEVAMHGRFGLLRQSSMRFQRQGVVYKPLADPIQVGCALAWRGDDRRPALVSLRDTLIAFSRQP